MKVKKALALIMAVTMAASLAACGSDTATESTPAAAEPESTVAEEAAPAEDTEAAAEGTEEAAAAEDATDYGGITLTVMNSKPEIQDALEAVTAAWGETHNVTFEVYETDSPSDMLAQRYAAGDPPVLAIVDPSQVTEMGEERFLDLSGEDWVADGGDTMGTKVNDVLYGFPLCVEAPGMVYNKTAIENITGEEFVPENYTAPEAFEELLATLREGGMENPVILNQEDWSLGGHLLGSNIYVFQDGTPDGAYAFVEDLKNGADIMENEMFQNLMQDYDIFIEYNINKDDPLAADYDLNASYIAEGEAAFWINGTWVWPDMSTYVDGTMDYGVMPIPKTNADMQGKIYAFASKQIAIDKEVATEEQQAAAKDFLNWLVYSEEGQSALVNDLEIVVAFTNNPNEPTNPVNAVLKTYIDAGLTVDSAPFSTPSDQTSVLAPHMQAYLAGQETIEDMAAAITEYWQTHDPS